MSRRAFRAILLTGVLLCLGGVATAAALLTTSSSARPAQQLAARAGSPATRDIPGKGEESVGGVTRAAAEALQARAYPAKDIPLSWSNKAQASWKGIVLKTQRMGIKSKSSTPTTPSLVAGAKSLALSATPGQWQSLGPDDSAVFPQTVTYSGARYVTSGRITALAVPPTSCSINGGCLLLVGAAGGGVWRTTNAMANPPTWTFVSTNFDTNAIGTLYVDPNNPSVIYAGTGEPNASGDSEAGTGIYKSTDGGATWGKIPGTETGGGAGCGTPNTGTCTLGANPFLGRSISGIAVESGNASHILVTTARGVRGVAAVTSSGVSLNANFPPIGLWESTDGGATWAYNWNANLSSRGATEVYFDPAGSRKTDVYTTAFSQGIWARRPSQSEPAFVNIYPANNTADTTDRTSIAVTTKAGSTRIYAYEGTAGPGSGDYNPASNVSKLWRIDNANQPAATLAASKAGGGTPPAVGAADYPAFFSGWKVLTSNDPGNPYFPTWNNCTGQCWYDNYVASPPGRPDDVYVGGSFSYAEFPNFTRGDAFGNEFSNARAVVYSNTAGDPDASQNRRTFTDMSFDRDTGQKDTCVNPYWSGDPGPGFPTSPAACLRAPNLMHPDQHAIAFNPSDPSIWFAGSDGGLVRPATSSELMTLGAESSSVLSNYASNCSVRVFLATFDQFLGCTRMNSAVPTRLISMNRGLRTLQYQMFAYNPANPGDITGGTQDNGTFERRVTPVALGGTGGDGSSQTDIWTEIIDGDGGWSGFDPSNPNRRFNWFSSPFGGVNYDNATELETHWFLDTLPVLTTETTLFYPPQVADPAVGQTFYLGARHVWRTQDWSNQAQVSNPLNDCDTRSGSLAGPCGDFQPMGGPAGTNNAGGLTGTFYGGTWTGGNVTADEPVKTDANTMWASTSTGRLFITQNRNCGTPTNAACVVWTRLDTLSAAAPNRYVSGIYVNPANPLQAWVSYTGYNSATPGTPGHVFRVDYNPVGSTATFTNLNVEAGLGAYPNTGGGDLPVTDIVRDDRNGNLYASTDFGVLKDAAGGVGAWAVFGTGLPMVEVPGLTIVMPNSIGGQQACVGNSQNPCVPAIYAATHGLSGWGTLLPNP